MNNFHNCNKAAIETFQCLADTKHEYVSAPSNPFATSFRIVTESGVGVSIAHSIDTNGILETILVNHDDSLNHDTLIYHESRKDLIEYLKTI